VATPRNLESTVGDVVFSGEAWGMPPGEVMKRGQAKGVGGARLHEVGSVHTPVGEALRDNQSTAGGRLLQHTFGAMPPARPTVGSRAHLSRAPLHHMSSTAAQVIWHYGA
jgi:hypothetical protein